MGEVIQLRANDSLRSMVAGLGDPFRDKMATASYGLQYIDDYQLAAWQFMQMCQATLFQAFIFQAKPSPSPDRIAKVVDSATRVFFAAYRPK